MFTRGVLTVFTWAFLLEIFVLIYYLGKDVKSVEFYMNIVLMFFTGVVLIFLILKEKKKKHDNEND